MELIAEVVVSLLLVGAGFFGLVGSFGLLKLPDTMTRLHAPTKATTLGVGGVLIASMVYFAFLGGGLSWHEFLITLFLFLTAPVSALFIAKAQIHRAVPPADLPPTGTGAEWAVLDGKAEARD
ncbi:Na+/H+ antiporter subunit G [Ruixingdingia sedimenti]|uniref:Na+/H+ antiporter subunit G n=1 Tax=Ruixingdingia sedimenti TaxID=3073604 RepID=A0ABU1F8U9_9RHOB|nr:Na+/H+ antiporter subunit G [Xinfangfangia sp. LG-4]MDR5653272.1 Na+/H+ antiporter subunit G [Xinfangfangia sp. LG-4]